MPVGSPEWVLVLEPVYYLHPTHLVWACLDGYVYDYILAYSAH